MMKRSLSRHRLVVLAGLFGVVGLGAAGLALSAAPAAPEASRVVKYSRQDVVPIHARLRFSTLIVLPEDEEILDFTTGDREFWVINGAHNLCYVHPAQAAIRTNLNLITASGHIYSFLLIETSNDPAAETDLKIFVERKEDQSVAGDTSLRGYVRATELEAYRKEAETLRAQTEAQVHAALAQASDEVNRFRADYAAKLHFDYEYNAKGRREPFLIAAIYHDDLFTYIRSSAREKPALYEVKDGKPNLINFQFENGVYVVPKILDSGYLAIGKKRLPFSRHVSVN
jgi:type IV secretion system protein VirB9